MPARAAGRPLRTLLAAAAAALLLLPTTAGARTGQSEPEVPVGGPALAGRGVVAGTARGLPPVPRTLSAAGWLIADLDTGVVLAARNAHGRFAPASTLKMLTAVSLLPVLQPGHVQQASFKDVNVEGSRVGLVPDGHYRADDLFRALLMVSANDAAATLASAAGGQTAAVATMNATAAQLQAHDTKAFNPSGLDATGQTSSPYDLALIARAGMQIPAFARYVGTLRSQMPAPRGTSFEIYNHNKLLTRYAGTLGVKNGYTVKARHSYVGAARRGTHTILVTLMRAETVYADARALLDWGFRAVGQVDPVGELVDPLPAAGAAATTAPSADAEAGHAVRGAAASGGGVRRVAPFALVLVVVASVVTLLRRRARRRRYGGRTDLRLRLPVR